MNVDEQFSDLRILGARNQEIIELVCQHCRHAHVEKSPLMGQGMMEAATGLPLDGREIRCPHAPNGSMAGMALESVAIDFYRRNCVGCKHRDPVGLPNLKSHVEAIDKENRREAEKAAERERALEDARRTRATARRERAADEPVPSQNFVALLDGVDSAEPDERAGELLDLARAAPELCTPLVSDILVETACAAATSQLIEAIGHLWRQGRIEGNRALQASLAALRIIGPMRVAAELMVELRDHVTADGVRPAIPALLALASPPELLTNQSKPYADGLGVAIEVDLPAVLDALFPLIRSDVKHVRTFGANAAQVLLRIKPSAASVLVRPLLHALTLPGSHDSYFGSPRPALTAALRQSLIAEPTKTTATILDVGSGMSEEERETLVAIFNVERRRKRNGPTGSDVVDRAIGACVLIADGRWGEQAARAAAEALKLFASHDAEALLPHATSLLGILMGAVAQPLSVDPTPGLEHLARMGAEAMRSGRLSRLTEAIGALIEHDPTALRDQVMAILDAEDPPGEEALTLRRELVELLPAFASRQEGLVDVLPRLYSALLHQDPGVRVAGVKAWRELTRTGFVAPPELEDLILSLLSDPYVHRAMVNALLFGLDVPERHRQGAMLTVLRLATLYASHDAYFLDDVLIVAWRLSHHFNPEISGPIQRRLLTLAEHLASSSDLRRMLTGVARDVSGPEMTDRLIQVVSREIGAPDDHNLDDLLRLLRKQPCELLVQHAQTIREAGRHYHRHWPESAAPLVEILQSAGRFDLAVELAEELVAAIPDTTEQASARLSAETVLSSARVELAAVSDDPSGVQAALDCWRSGNEQLDVIRSQRIQPWDVDQ